MSADQGRSSTDASEDRPGTENATGTDPKVFVSYSWTTPEHRQWVVDLCNRLVADGVEVVADFWDLKAGADAFHFMELSVRDPSITHVLVVCDEGYEEKADSGKGGVGYEKQVLTPDLAKGIDSGKFVPIVAERKDGEPCVPTFIRSRIHIDLSSEQVFFEGYDQLLRHLHGKPAHPKPPLGSPPTYLSENTPTGSAIRHIYLRAMEHVRKADRSARGSVLDYLDAFSRKVGELQRSRVDGEPFDETLYEAAHGFKVYRDEFLDITAALARYLPDDATWPIDPEFFEGLVGRCYGPGGHTSDEVEGVCFAVYETYLSYLTILGASSHTLSAVSDLLGDRFLLPSSGGPWPEGVGAFYFGFDQLERQRTTRTKSNRHSLVADMLKERADHSAASFDALQETDFLLYLRGRFDHSNWYPRTLVYMSHWVSAFPLFRDLQSPRRKAKLEAFLGKNVDDLVSSFEEAFPPDHRSVTVGNWPLSVPRLMNLDQIAPEKFGGTD